MFECRSCLAQSIRALLSSEPALSQSQRQVLALTPRLSQPQRRYASLETEQKRRDDAAIPLITSKSPQDISPVPKRHLELELAWLRDRVKMAKHVKSLIHEKDEMEKAIALVRLASNISEENQYIVAWNHILRWHVMQGRHNRAFQLFNDMKKRGQKPDSYTYLIMLSGPERTRAQGKRPSSVNLARVVQIFESMQKPNSGAEQLIIHANAALKACADAGDLDQLWTILSRLPEEGLTSADAVTYTLILDAIRSATFDKENLDGSEKSVQEQIEAVEKGRSMWIDVIKRWRAGQIKLDEKLVVAMARLLLASPRLQDWDAVLTLVDQTCNIERQVAEVSDPSRNTEHIPENKYLNIPQRPESEEEDQVSTEDVFRPVDDFRSKTDKHLRLAKMIQHVLPGNGILAMLLDAIRKIRSPSTARKYWSILEAKPFNLIPDISNVEKMLQICALNRQSGLAAHIVCNELPQYKVKPRNLTMRIALDACLRNKKSDRTEADADSLLQVLMKELETPDMQAVELYIQLALSTKQDTRIAHAVDQLQPILSTLKTILNQEGSRSSLSFDDTQTFLRSYDRAISTLLQSKFGDDAKQWLAKRAVGSRLLQTVDSILTQTSSGDVGMDITSKRRVSKSAEPLASPQDELLGLTPQPTRNADASEASLQDQRTEKLRTQSQQNFARLRAGYKLTQARREYRLKKPTLKFEVRDNRQSTKHNGSRQTMTSSWSSRPQRGRN